MNQSIEDDPIYTERGLARYLGLSVPTIQRLRSDGTGPCFVQLSERRIGYRRSAVDAWLNARTKQCISPAAIPQFPAGRAL
jgi:predicted DNA-binding transcriptional regulator AlpA